MIACKKTPTPEPASPPPVSITHQKVTPDSVIHPDTHHYNYPQDSLRKWILGHTYEVTYYNENYLNRIDSLHISHLGANHVVWALDGSIKECGYTQQSPYTSNDFNYGTYLIYNAGYIIANTNLYPNEGFTMTGYNLQENTFSIHISGHFVAANISTQNIRVDFKMIY